MKRSVALLLLAGLALLLGSMGGHAQKDEGRALVLASSDLQEVLAVADRILVMRDGQLDGRDVARDPEAVLRAALGGRALGGDTA